MQNNFKHCKSHCNKWNSSYFDRYLWSSDLFGCNTTTQHDFLPHSIITNRFFINFKRIVRSLDFYGSNKQVFSVQSSETTQRESNQVCCIFSTQGYSQTPQAGGRTGKLTCQHNPSLCFTIDNVTWSQMFSEAAGSFRIYR